MAAHSKDTISQAGKCDLCHVLQARMLAERMFEQDAKRADAVAQQLLLEEELEQAHSANKKAKKQRQKAKIQLSQAAKQEVPSTLAEPEQPDSSASSTHLDAAPAIELGSSPSLRNLAHRDSTDAEQESKQFSGGGSFARSVQSVSAPSVNMGAVGTAESDSSQALLQSVCLPICYQQDHKDTDATTGTHYDESSVSWSVSASTSSSHPHSLLQSTPRPPLVGSSAATEVLQRAPSGQDKHDGNSLGKLLSCPITQVSCGTSIHCQGKHLTGA